MKAKLDLKLIKQNTTKNFFILDSSAIFKDHEINLYREKYLGIKGPACFLLTTIILKELDDTKFKSPSLRQAHKDFMQLLRDIQRMGKLSNGIGINAKGDQVLYFPDNLEGLNDDKFAFLNREYADRQLLILARVLKREKINVTIISQDSLIGVLCKENGIKYLYLMEKRISGPRPKKEIIVTNGKSKKSEVYLPNWKE